MADKLTLKGVRTVTKHTGTELRYVIPKRGGPTHLFPRWWNKKGTVQYVECTIFHVTRAAGNIRLVIPTNIDNSEITIQYDGADSFTFSGIRGVDRVLLANETDTTAYVEYLFPSISGGKILKRTIANLPTADTSIGIVTVTGSAKANVDQSKTYTVASSGDASKLSYSWSVTGDGGEIPGSTTGTTCSVTLTAEGSSTIKCSVSSTDPNLGGPSSVTGSKTVTVSTP